MASASAPALEPGGWALPQFKGRPGWEFTDITGLDLAAYERVGVEGTPDVAEALWELAEPQLAEQQPDVRP